MTLTAWRMATIAKGRLPHDGHLRQPHVARLIVALPELSDGQLDIAAHEVAGSGPLPLPG